MWHETEGMRSILKALWMYLTLLWVGMLLFRIGGSAEHQFRMVFLCVIALVALFKIGMSNRLIGCLLIGLGTYAASFDGFTGRPFSAILSQGIATEHMHYESDWDMVSK